MIIISIIFIIVIIIVIMLIIIKIINRIRCRIVGMSNVKLHLIMIIDMN